MKELLKNNLMSFLLILFVTAWTLINFDKLPGQIPTHFDINGNADKFSSKEFSLWFMPVVCLSVLFIVNGLLAVSPEKFSANQSKSALSRLNFGIVLFLMVIQIASIQEAIQPGQWMSKALPIGMGLLTIFIGNYLGKIEKNFVVGIRVPWTLASDENWKQTHRFAGKTYFIAGVASLILAFLFPNTFIAVGLLILASVSSVFYSYMYFRN